MRYGPIFLMLGVTLAAGAVSASEWWQRLLLASAGVSFAVVGAAFLGAGPRVFGKRRTGELAPWSWPLLWPYHALNALALLALRLGRERVWDEVAPGLFLGRQPTILDRAALRKLGLRGVLDLTCEFSELPDLRSLPGYRSLPLLDTTSPTPAQLDEGVRAIREALREGAVLVHCALGHGRSATFVCAFLMSQQPHLRPEDAIGMVRSRRPGAAPSRAQVAALHEWRQEGQ